MKMHSLMDLLTHELKDLYDAEHQIVEALPKMAEAAADQELKDGFVEHLEQTEDQIRRLEQAFELLGMEPDRVKCDGMHGIIKECEHVLKTKMEDDVRDAALIAAAQRVEHYEIAAYGTVRAYAEELGEDEVAALMSETLKEEQETDTKLTKLSKEANPRAAELEMVAA